MFTKMELSFLTRTLILFVYLINQWSVSAYSVSKITWNRCVPQDNIFVIFRNISLDTCVSKCLEQSECGSVNYHRKHGICRLARNAVGLSSDTYVCQVYILMERVDMNNDPAEGGNSTNQTICLQENFGKDGNCEVRGNMVTPTNKALLQCEITEYMCCKTIFMCRQDGAWMFERCLQQCYIKVDTVDPTIPVANYVNVALGKTVSMSGQYNHLSPGKLLVDGDRSSRWPCAGTPYSTKPYMMIDLGQLYTITNMFIVNRGDCCAKRLHDLRISFGQTLDLMDELVHIPGVFGPRGTVQLSVPVTIRYIHITILDNAMLTICEFEVWNALN